MRIYQTEVYEDMSRKTAELIADYISAKPDCVLGLATGSTPVGAYRMLSGWCGEGYLSFAGVRTVNLDEYVGLAPDDPQSYHAFMRMHLFEHIDALPENLHLPDGMAEDPEQECLRYDALIESLGGVDLQLLGIGRNGHIGFNEPGGSFDSVTHVAVLDENTRKVNSRFFENPDMVPRKAITMGIQNIMGAKRVLLAASGPEKSEILAQAFAGPVTPRLPASILQLHPDVILVADRAALSGLTRRGVVPSRTPV